MINHPLRASFLLLLATFYLGGCVCNRASEQGHTQAEDAAPAISLIDPELTRWQKVNFGGEGDIYFKEGALNLDYGHPLTGLRYKGDPATILGEDLDNYEITLEAMRVEGVDMFLGLTFPVGMDGHVSLVLGGWAGAITGLSNLDGLNASENVTTQYHNMPAKQWFKVKIRVTTTKIQCWLDEKQLVDVDRANFEEYDTHGAVVDTKPLGMFSYATWGRVRDMKVRKLR